MISFLHVVVAVVVVVVVDLKSVKMFSTLIKVVVHRRQLAYRFNDFFAGVSRTEANPIKFVMS